MLKNRIIYIIFIGFSILLQALYRNDLPYSTILFAIILTAFSFVHFIICIFSLKHTLLLNASSFQKKELATMYVQVKRKFFIPIPYLILSYRLPFSSVKVTKATSLIWDKTLKIDLSTMCEKIGIYMLQLDSITIMDLFGIFKWKVSLHDKKEFYVLPKIHTLAPFILSYAEQDFSHTNQFVQNGVIDSVREFTHADNAKHIHWNLSSKLEDNFYTKVFVEQTTQQVTIISDLKNESTSGSLSKEKAETILETTLSLAQCINQEEIICNLLWFDEKKETIATKEHYVLSQEKDPCELLLFFDLYTKGPSLQELFALHQSQLEQHTVFIITTSLTAFTVQALTNQSRNLNQSIRFIYIDAMGDIGNHKRHLYHLHEANIPVFIIEKLDPSTLYQLT